MYEFRRFVHANARKPRHNTTRAWFRWLFVPADRFLHRFYDYS